MSINQNAQTQWHEDRRFGVLQSAGSCAASSEDRRGGLKTHVVHSRTKHKGVANKPIVEISAIIKKKITVN